LQPLYAAGDIPLNEDVTSHYHYALSLLPEAPVELDLPTTLARIGKAARNYTDYMLAAELVSLGEERCSRLSDSMQRRLERALSQRPDIFEEDMTALRLTGQALRTQIGQGQVLLTPAMAHPADLHGVETLNQPERFSDSRRCFRLALHRVPGRPDRRPDADLAPVDRSPRKRGASPRSGPHAERPHARLCPA
jgi:hypothetical protein